MSHHKRIINIDNKEEGRTTFTKGEISCNTAFLLAIYDYVRIHGSIYGYTMVKQLIYMGKNCIHVIDHKNETIPITIAMVSSIANHNNDIPQYLSSLLSGNTYKTCGFPIYEKTPHLLNLIGRKYSDKLTMYMRNMYYIFKNMNDGYIGSLRLIPSISNMILSIRNFNDALNSYYSKQIDPLYEIAIYYNSYKLYIDWLLDEYKYSRTLINHPTYMDLMAFNMKEVEVLKAQLMEILGITDQQMVKIFNGGYKCDIAGHLVDCDLMFTTSNRHLSTVDFENSTKIIELDIPAHIKLSMKSFTHTIDSKCDKYKEMIRRLGNYLFTVKEKDKDWTFIIGAHRLLDLIKIKYPNSTIMEKLPEEFNTGEMLPVLDHICQRDRRYTIFRKKKHSDKNIKAVKEYSEIKDKVYTVGNITMINDTSIFPVIQSDNKKSIFKKRYYVSLMVNSTQIEKDNVWYSATITDEYNNNVIINVIDCIIYNDKNVKVVYHDMYLDSEIIDSIIGDVVSSYKQQNNEEDSFMVTGPILFKSHKVVTEITISDVDLTKGSDEHNKENND